MSGNQEYRAVFCGIGWYWRVLEPHPHPQATRPPQDSQTPKPNPQAEHFPLDQPDKRCYITIANGAGTTRTQASQLPRVANPENIYKGENIMNLDTTQYYRLYAKFPEQKTYKALDLIDGTQVDNLILASLLRKQEGLRIQAELTRMYPEASFSLRPTLTQKQANDILDSII